MSPSLLRFRVAVLFVSAACAAESSAGETIRIVNQAQMPVASIRIVREDRPVDTAQLPGARGDAVAGAAVASEPDTAERRELRKNWAAHIRRV